MRPTLGNKYPGGKVEQAFQNSPRKWVLTLTIPLIINTRAALLSHRGYRTTANAEQNAQRIPITTQTEKPVTLYTVDAPNRGRGMRIMNTTVCKKEIPPLIRNTLSKVFSLEPYHDHGRPHSKSERLLEAHGIEFIVELNFI